MQQPNIAILSDEFLAEVKGMPQRDLALEMLRKPLNDREARLPLRHGSPVFPEARSR